MSTLGKKSKKKALSGSNHRIGLKRGRTPSDESTDSADSFPMPCSSTTDQSISIEIDLGQTIQDENVVMDEIKIEPTDEEMDADLLETGLDEALIEPIKNEIEDDPLTMESGTNEEHKEFENPCDEDFLPGSSQNLPLVDTMAVTEVFMTFPEEEKLAIRELWRRAPEELNDQIGYVQVKRVEDTCTIKCEVATKTTSNQIEISYDETNHIVLETICDCAKLYCSHVMAGLIWLSRPVSPGTHWLQPMVTRDPSTLTIKALFGISKKENVQPTFDVLGEFLGMCKAKKLYSPAIMKYYFEDERTKASLHILICNYQKTAFTNVDSFLNYCKENITKKDCDNALDPALPLDVVQELIYGRITNDILHQVSKHDTDVEALLDKITLPEPEEKAVLPAEAINSLEKSLKMKITRCGLLISKEYPMFAAYPYGITDTHVVETKRITDSSDYKVKITPEIFASMQLQMFLAKKENACYCVVCNTNRIDVMMVKYNKTMMTGLIERATKFWKTHVFDRINMN